MSCPKPKKTPEYKSSVVYVSDGRNAMWHLPFPFLHPSDIGVRLIDPNGIEKPLRTPDEFLAYWDYVVCVVPVGWRIKLWLIPPLEEVLAGRAILPGTKQVLDSHKVKAVPAGEYDSESEDGVYIELETDSLPDKPCSDVPSPELQNDRRVLVEGTDRPHPVTPDADGQHVPHNHHDTCCPLHYHVHHHHVPPRHVSSVRPNDPWLPGGC